MLQPPDLPEPQIAGALRTGFGIEAAALEFLPLGNDAGSWAYRVQDGPGRAYFLKIRSPADDTRGADVPAYLQQHGVPRVLAPLRAGTGAAWIPAGRFALALYPFVDGRPAAEAGLSAAQWRELGAIVRAIHETPVTPELTALVGREVFRPTRYGLFGRLHQVLTSPDPGDGLARELAAAWQARAGAIRQVTAQVDALGQRFGGLDIPHVLCHADLHTYNVLTDGPGQLWVADWDEVILAPRERDLMFVIRGIGNGLMTPDGTAGFLDGYGAAAADEGLLTYYRYAWAAQDIAACAEEVLFLPGRGPDSRRAALDGSSPCSSRATSSTWLSPRRRGHARDRHRAALGPEYAITHRRRHCLDREAEVPPDLVSRA
jgi:spectinomycin phosphotransferase